MEYWILLFLMGFSFTLWAVVGGTRLLFEAYTTRRRSANSGGGTAPHLTADDVAVLIPARNEEAAIGAAIAAVMKQVPAQNIHVVADGCTDRTAEVARAYGVNILVLTPSRGKAGGIEAAVQHFDFAQRFTVALILDADTQLDDHYISRGLALLEDPEVGAVAGYVYSSWRPGELSTVGRLLVSYRTRLWAVMQSIKYGQTWRYTDVTPIVPGFASMYRTHILSSMDLNPPGMVIEDFNMTFELRHKKLGRVAFQPAVSATAQDPGNFRDYYRQITRWSLGFWQTLRHHGVWYSGFTAALLLFVVESLLASIVTIGISVAVVVAALVPETSPALLGWDWYSAFLRPLKEVLTPANLLLFIFVPDYLMTLAVAIWLRRPSLLIYGVAFPFLRLVDSTATLRGLWQLRSARSTGKWTPPARRPVETPSIIEAHVMAGAAYQEESAPSAPTSAGGAESESQAPQRQALRNWRAALPILRDAALASAVLVLVGVLVMGGLPLTATLAAIILALPVAAVWSYRRRQC